MRSVQIDTYVYVLKPKQYWTWISRILKNHVKERNQYRSFAYEIICLNPRLLKTGDHPRQNPLCDACMHRKDLIGWTVCESRVRFASIYGRDVFVQLRLIIYIHVKVNWFSLFNMISQCIYDTFIHVNRRKVSFI